MDRMTPGPTTLGVCNLCEAICGLELTVEDGRVTAIRGNADDPLSRGYICPKGVSLADVYDDPDRLRRPVRRVGAGPDAQWVEIGWDEALDLVADGLAGAVNRHGRDARRRLPRQPQRALAGLGHPRPAVHQEPADPQPVQRLVGRPDPAPVRGLAAVRPPAAAAGARHRPHVVLPGVRRQPDGLQRLADDGAGLPATGCARSRRAAAGWSCSTRAAPRPPRSATEHHFVRPGTDALVLLAMLHVLFEDGLTRPPSYVDNARAVRGGAWPASPRSWPSRAAGSRRRRSAGSPASSRRPTRRRPTGGSASRRTGSARSASGRSSCLNLLTGNFDREGGVLFPEPAVDAVGRRIIGPGHYDVWRSRVRGIPEFAGELPGRDVRARRSRRPARARSGRC